MMTIFNINSCFIWMSSMVSIFNIIFVFMNDINHSILLMGIRPFCQFQLDFLLYWVSSCYLSIKPMWSVNISIIRFMQCWFSPQFCRYTLLTLVSEAICHLIYPFRWQVSSLIILEPVEIYVFMHFSRVAAYSKWLVVYPGRPFPLVYFVSLLCLCSADPFFPLCFYFFMFMHSVISYLFSLK